jgi:hypothetical protein
MLDYCVFDVNLWVAVLTALAAFKRWRVLLAVFRALSAPPWASRVGNELLRSAKVVTVFEQVAIAHAAVVHALFHLLCTQTVHQPLKELMAMPVEARVACLTDHSDVAGAPAPHTAAAVLHDVVTLVRSCPVSEALNLKHLIEVVLLCRRRAVLSLNLLAQAFKALEAPSLVPLITSIVLCFPVPADRCCDDASALPSTRQGHLLSLLLQGPCAWRAATRPCGCAACTVSALRRRSQHCAGC